MNGNGRAALTEAKLPCLVEEFSWRFALYVKFVPIEGKKAANADLNDRIDFNVLLLTIVFDPVRRIRDCEIWFAITNLPNSCRKIGNSRKFVSFCDVVQYYMNIRTNSNI